VLDALAPLQIKSIDMPLNPEKIWTLVQAARQGQLKPADTTPPAVFNAQTRPQEGSRPGFV
jgi:hypothetical protein